MEKEVSCRVTNSIIEYIESEGYDSSPLWQELPCSKAYLTDPFNWVTAEIRETIAQRAAVLTGDSKVMYRVGLATASLRPLAGFEHLVRLIGTPLQAYKAVPRLASFFDNVLDFQVTAICGNSVTIRVFPRKKFTNTPATCYYIQGLMAVVPTLWKLPPAIVVELQCGCQKSMVGRNLTHVTGPKPCIYEVTWQAYPTRHFKIHNLFTKDKDINVATVKELERTFQLLDQKNSELVARNTDLEATRNRLASSEEKLRLIIESLSEGLLVTDSNGKITQTNAAAARLLGHASSAEMIGRDALRYVSRRNLKSIFESVKNSGDKGDTASAEAVLATSDGRRFPAEIIFSRIKNSSDEPAEFVSSFRDISHRKEAVEKLTESERKYRLIADNTTDFISIMNFAGFYLYISPSHRLLGYDPDELVGKNGMELIHPEDKVRLLPLLVKHAGMKLVELLELKKNNSSETVKFRFPDKSGNWHNIEATANLIEDKYGTGYNILIISRDVTVRTQADDELKKLYQAEIELRRALEDEIKKRAEFFRALVHELKTPLTPIIASSEAVMNLSDEPTLKRLAANAFNGAVRLNSRVDELLDLSRGEMGMLKVTCQPMNLLSLIKDLAGYVQPQIDDNNQKLVLDLPPHLPPVLADELRLRQVILNLLNNAMKFMPIGGQITVQARKVEDNVVVEVIDTGQGIDESEQKRLFQPYNRVEADRQHFSGLGLGLALCKKLIDLHNGKIWCHSQKGNGSTFGFSVAIYKEPAPQPLKNPDTTLPISA